MPVTKTSKTYVTTGKISFFYCQGYCWHPNLLGFNISFYEFHLVWSAEMSQSQIVTFTSLAYYIRYFLLKNVEGATAWWHVFNNFQVPKLLGKKLCKKIWFCTFLKSQHLRQNKETCPQCFVVDFEQLNASRFIKH